MKTKKIYYLPLAQGTIEKIVTESPAHLPPYENALDLAVPLGTEVFAPEIGEVISVVDHHSKFGSSRKFAPYCNYIQIQHTNGEVSDLIHLKKGSALVKVGDIVKTGQKLALTGNSGWLTAPHLHWMVFKSNSSAAGFESLTIQL